MEAVAVNLRQRANKVLAFVCLYLFFSRFSLRYTRSFFLFFVLISILAFGKHDKVALAISVSI